MFSVKKKHPQRRGFMAHLSAVIYLLLVVGVAYGLVVFADNAARNQSRLTTGALFTAELLFVAIVFWPRLRPIRMFAGFVLTGLSLAVLITPALAGQDMCNYMDTAWRNQVIDTVKEYGFSENSYHKNSSTDNSTTPRYQEGYHSNEKYFGDACLSKFYFGEYDIDTNLEISIILNKLKKKLYSDFTPANSVRIELPNTDATCFYHFSQYPSTTNGGNLLLACIKGSHYVDIDIKITVRENDGSTAEKLSKPLLLDLMSQFLQHLPNDYLEESDDSRDDPDETLFPSPGQIAVITAAIAAILLAAGIAAQIANSIAAALAQAIQACVELTSEEISEAIAEGLIESAALPQEESQAAAPISTSPPLYDKEGKPFKRNEQGEYWAPDDKGKWVWMGEQDARNASISLRNELSQREEETRIHDQETDAMREKWRRDTQDRHAAERAQEVAEKERLRAAAREQAQQQDNDEVPAEEAQSIENIIAATPGIDNTGIGWGINLAKEFVRGSVKDGIDLVTESPGAIVDAIASGASSAGKLLSDPENWRIAKETAIDTLVDITAPLRGDVDRSIKLGKNITEGGLAVGKIGGHLVKSAWDDPSGAAVAVGRAVLGVDNWKKAIDPNVPVTERMGRAIWGAIDTGGVLVSAGSIALKGANKLGGLVRIADTAGDALKGTKAIDTAVDAAKGADAANDVAKSVDAVGDVVKSVDTASDAAKSVDAASDAVKSVDLAGDSAKGAKAVEETREASKAIKRNRDLLPEGRIGGPNTERHGIPHMATDPEGYVRGLPSGALVDRNLANGTGYTGAQIDDMARFAKNENVIVGARSTNVDSMRHIRDGNAVPKPITIKSKTIGETDTYLGARVEDKGLVGYFRPNKPDPDKVPAHLWEKVSERYDTRLKEYAENRDSINKFISEGKMVERDGKLHAVIRKADGTTEIKPFAGDIDGVYFKDATTGDLIPPGERYERLKAGWTGNTEEYNRRLASESASQGAKPDLVPNYWKKSGAPGQHGVETNLVADITSPYKPGTPEYEKALKKATELHGKLADNHWKGGGETVLQMGPDGHLRRGIRFTEDVPLPDGTRMI